MAGTRIDSTRLAGKAMYRKSRRVRQQFTQRRLTDGVLLLIVILLMPIIRPGERYHSLLAQT